MILYIHLYSHLEGDEKHISLFTGIYRVVIPYLFSKLKPLKPLVIICFDLVDLENPGLCPPPCPSPVPLFPAGPMPRRRLVILRLF